MIPKIAVPARSQQADLLVLITAAAAAAAATATVVASALLPRCAIAFTLAADEDDFIMLVLLALAAAQQQQQQQQYHRTLRHAAADGSLHIQLTKLLMENTTAQYIAHGMVLYSTLGVVISNATSPIG